MGKMAYRFGIRLPALMSILALLSAAGLRQQASTEVTLSEARFNGLTRIVVTTNVALTGIDADHIVVTRPDGSVIPPSKITDIAVSTNALTGVIDADQFARITSEGTTIATKAYYHFGPGAAMPVRILN